MIAVLDLWNRINAYGAKYQSGTDVVAYFNTALAEVQIELFNDLSPLYDENEKVKTLLDIWVKEQVGSSNSGGVVTAGTNPEVVNRPISIGYTDGSGNILFSIVEIDESELIAIARMPQRKPNSSKKNVYYRFNSPSTVQLYPKEIVSYDMFYFIYPTAALIVFTFSTTANEDIMTYDSVNSVNLQWPQTAFNLIMYKMLEKYGVTVREELLQAYAKFGFIQSESLKEANAQ